MFGERPLAVGNALAVIAPKKDDRVVGEPVRLEVGADLADVRVECSSEFQPLSERPPDARSVGVIGRHGDIGRLAACLWGQHPAHLSGFVVEQPGLMWYSD